VTDVRRLSLSDPGDDAGDIDELIHSFAEAYLRVFSVSVR